MNLLSPSSRVLIATFSPWRAGKRLPTNGNVEPMVEFFTKRAGETVLIDQVYPGSDRVLPRIEVYRQKRRVAATTSSLWLRLLSPLLWLTNSEGTRIFFKLRDFLSVIDWCLHDPKPYDVFIGFESVNALAGVLLRRWGRVKRVVYYVSDYSPKRYPSPLMNRLYVWLDRLAASRADFIWDVSAAMHPARVSAGLDPHSSAPVIRVPNALYPWQIRRTFPLSKRIQPSVVFMGTLGEENGPGLAIEALGRLVARYPDMTLHVIGGPPREVRRLRRLAKRLSLAHRVVFHGFIASRRKLAMVLRRFSVALAPYRALEGSVRWWGDATKIRAYLAAGLPVVTTRVPPLGKEIEAAGAGIIVPDTPAGIAEGVAKIFGNPDLFLSMRAAAVAFAKSNTWEREFRRAFQQMDSQEKNFR